MGARILVVEDNPDNMKLVTWVLEDHEYDFVEAWTAEEAFEHLELGEFDLVLMDISLPGMDGKEATRKLRSDPRFVDLPIIAVTAHAISGEADAIRQSGVSTILTKPLDETQLMETIQKYLKKKPA